MLQPRSGDYGAIQVNEPRSGDYGASQVNELRSGDRKPTAPSR